MSAGSSTTALSTPTDEMLAALQTVKEAITYDSEEEAEVGRWALPIQAAQVMYLAIAHATGEVNA